MQGDALASLARMPAASVAAVITDPPYGSGGPHSSDQARSPRTKYFQNDRKTADALVDLGGDGRDQRSWTYWSTLWLAEALRVTVPGGVLAMTCDWRQLPAATDALQAGGWIWRGVATWIKPNPRPQRGRFDNPGEYVVWGIHGPRALTGRRLPGNYLASAPRVRWHGTEKPLALMRGLVRIAEPGAVVLDPFAGSGSTGVAALLEGRRFLGIEAHPYYQQTAARRLAVIAEALARGIDPGDPRTPTELAELHAILASDQTGTSAD